MVPSNIALASLTFRLARDDGAVVWVNGREAYRSNMPGGNITSSTLASSTVNTPEEQIFYVTTLAMTNVVEGTNVIGVEVHQVAANSSDLGFNLELDADGFILSSDAAPPVLAATISGGLIQIAWPASATEYRLYSSSEVGVASSWNRVNETPLSTNGLNLLTIPATNAAAFYRLQR